MDGEEEREKEIGGEKERERVIKVNIFLFVDKMINRERVI